MFIVVYYSGIGRTVSDLNKKEAARQVGICVNGSEDSSDP